MITINLQWHWIITLPVILFLVYKVFFEKSKPGYADFTPLVHLVILIILLLILGGIYIW